MKRQHVLLVLLILTLLLQSIVVMPAQAKSMSIESVVDRLSWVPAEFNGLPDFQCTPGLTKIDISGDRDYWYGNIRFEVKGPDITPHGGSVSICVKAAKNNSGMITLQDGEKYTVGWLNKGGQVPNISNFVVYATTENPTPTFTPTNTWVPPTQTDEPTPTDTATGSPTPQSTPTKQSTSTSTPTDTPTNTATFTPTLTITPSFTPSNTATDEPTPTWTATFTLTPTFTVTATFTATETNTPTLTITPSFTPSNTATDEPTKTATVTLTFTPTFTATFTETATYTPTPTHTATATDTPTNTPTLTASPTPVQPTCDGLRYQLSGPYAPVDVTLTGLYTDPDRQVTGTLIAGNGYSSNTNPATFTGLPAGKYLFIFVLHTATADVTSDVCEVQFTVVDEPTATHTATDEPTSTPTGTVPPTDEPTETPTFTPTPTDEYTVCDEVITVIETDDTGEEWTVTRDVRTGELCGRLALPQATSLPVEIDCWDYILAEYRTEALFGFVDIAEILRVDDTSGEFYNLTDFRRHGIGEDRDANALDCELYAFMRNGMLYIGTVDGQIIAEAFVQLDGVKATFAVTNVATNGMNRFAAIVQEGMLMVGEAHEQSGELTNVVNVSLPGLTDIAMMNNSQGDLAVVINEKLGFVSHDLSVLYMTDMFMTGGLNFTATNRTLLGKRWPKTITAFDMETGRAKTSIVDATYAEMDPREEPIFPYAYYALAVENARLNHGSLDEDLEVGINYPLDLPAVFDFLNSFVDLDLPDWFADPDRRQKAEINLADIDFDIWRSDVEEIALDPIPVE